MARSILDKLKEHVLSQEQVNTMNRLEQLGYKFSCFMHDNSVEMDVTPCTGNMSTLIYVERDGSTNNGR